MFELIKLIEFTYLHSISVYFQLWSAANLHSPAFKLELSKMVIDKVIVQVDEMKNCLGDRLKETLKDVMKWVNT